MSYALTSRRLRRSSRTDQNARPPLNYRFTLYLDKVSAGVAYKGPWQWDIPSGAYLEIPRGTFTPFAGETGLDSYRFHLTATAVPEAAGLVVLISGLGCPAAALLRRRP